ncbi:MAG TPA: c-type cytochrome domain-containing protein [Fimbriimonadaceae bacterium]|nr:c-type cytochrome domain-containing protein [Fimbriimonadaceae bacterium]
MQVPRNAVALGLLAAASFSLALGLGMPLKPKPKPVKKVPFSTVAPIFKQCVGCHMGAHPKHGLDLTSYASLMKGDKEGKVVVPGKPASSRLSKAVHRKGAAAMPPMGPLSAGDVAKIDAWIAAGAKEK